VSGPSGIAFTKKGPTALLAVETQLLDCARAAKLKKSSKETVVTARGRRYSARGIVRSIGKVDEF